MHPDMAAVLSSVMEPAVIGRGSDLEGVEITQAGRRLIVRVLVDRDGGVDLDEVAVMSAELSAALDDSEVAAGVLGDRPYVLEVSSPGVDRPLRLPRHWRRAVGRLVVVYLRDGATLEGRVVAADDDTITVGDRAIDLGDVDRGVVQVEFVRRGED